MNAELDAIIEFLGIYRVDREARNISLPLICAYIERQRELGELQNWVVAVKGLESSDPNLGQIDLGLTGGMVYPISRTRLSGDPDSLGVITSPGDEEEGLSDEELGQSRLLQQSEQIGANPAARRVRPVTNGLLLIYPISRYSGYNLRQGGSRRQLYDDTTDPRVRDVIGLAISFPYSDRAQRIMGQYIVGTVGWRPV